MTRHRSDSPAARAPAAVARLLTVVPPASGAAVMGTGIVSVVLRLHGRDAASEALMWVAALLWAALALLLGARVRWHRDRFAREAASPGSLAGVAGTCVLGTRLALHGWTMPAGLLLACAAGAWLPLLAAVLGHWRRPAAGAGFLLAVSTHAIALLCATLASATGAAWLAVAALAPLAGALALYAFVLVSFDRGELRRGRGDQWVAGGALAIGALATATSAATAERLHVLEGVRSPLTVASVALWALALAWLPFLVAGELRRPLRGFDARRWASVFPLGMYAAMSFAVGDRAGAAWIVDFARAWTWVAVAAWALVAACSVQRGAELLAAPSPHSR